MVVTAYCELCKKAVSDALVCIEPDKLKATLNGNGPVQVMHTTAEHGDHRWTITPTERKNLAKVVLSGV